VKSIAELHGGSAEISSEVGKGTRVRLSLPVEMTKTSSSGHAPVN
jgi:signal transduction histidine kinase